MTPASVRGYLEKTMYNPVNMSPLHALELLARNTIYQGGLSPGERRAQTLLQRDQFNLPTDITSPY
jgi:hypothetical protein